MVRFLSAWKSCFSSHTQGTERFLENTLLKASRLPSFMEVEVRTAFHTGKGAFLAFPMALTIPGRGLPSQLACQCAPDALWPSSPPGQRAFDPSTLQGHRGGHDPAPVPATGSSQSRSSAQQGLLRSSVPCVLPPPSPDSPLPCLCRSLQRNAGGPEPAILHALLLSCSRSLTSHPVVPPWTVARQAPLSMGFPRQEYWSGWPFPTPGHLLNPWIKPTSPALAGGFLTTSHQGSPLHTMGTY